MRIVNSATGNTYFRKRRQRIDEPGHAREFIFTCYKRFALLSRDRVRQWFINALVDARSKLSVDLWAYVIMPDHIHLHLHPRDSDVEAGRVVGKIKEAVA